SGAGRRWGGIWGPAASSTNAATTPTSTRRRITRGKIEGAPARGWSVGEPSRPRQARVVRRQYPPSGLTRTCQSGKCNYASQYGKYAPAPDRRGGRRRAARRRGVARRPRPRRRDALRVLHVDERRDRRADRGDGGGLRGRRPLARRGRGRGLRRRRRRAA